MTDEELPLPPFVLEQACEKCNEYDAHPVTYMSYGRCIHPDATVGVRQNERLHRRCSRCRFQWDEAIFS